MNPEIDVAVVGAGIIGLAASLAMGLRGHRVALIDAGSMQVNCNQPDARVYAINQASQDLLSQLGVWQQIEHSRRSPYRSMFVWDAANGAKIEFDSRLIAQEYLGTIIEESILKQKLFDVLSTKENIILYPNTKITQLQSTEQSIQLIADNFDKQAQLLMIADGANSPCRELLQLPMNTWSYHQEAIVALINTELPHQQTAYQVFNQDGPLAFLPLVAEKQCSIVWSTTTDRSKELMSLADEEFNAALTSAFAGKLGEVKVQGSRFQFPLRMRHVKQYTGSRWLLLGDAAHTIHPLAGLGLNLGLADLATWITCSEGASSFNSKRILGAYQRQRKHAVWQMIAVMEGFKTLFTHSLSPVVRLRGWGLDFCDRFSPIKRFFIEQAAGRKVFLDEV